MKVYQTDQIRNLALLGNAGSGKTTFCECFMYNAGVIDRMGSVHNKNTVSDFKEIEHQNESSVFSSIISAEYKNHKINFIDNPGADDFIGQLIPSLRVAETGLMLINAQNGVEVGTEIQARFAAEQNLPLIFGINHLDHEKANFLNAIDTLKQSFGSSVIVAQYPVNPGNDFDAIIDIITMKMYKFTEGKKEPEIVDIPENEMDRALEYQNELIEKAAESDDSLMEIFFEKETLSEDEMRSGIKEGMLARELFPVFCLSSKKNMGINRLVEFIINVSPNPSDIKGVATADGKEVTYDASAPTSLFVFKTSYEEHIGKVNYFKVRQGTLTENQDLINVSHNKTKERFAQIFSASGKNRHKVEKLVAGDIGATVKLKTPKTNHTHSTYLLHL